MTTENKFMEMVKEDASDAAYRVASNQLTKATKTALLKLFQQKGSKKAHLNAMKELLDSPAGDALVSCILGFGITYVPGLKDDARVQVLAKEFRVNGMATAGNFAMETVLSEFLPVILDTLKTLPPMEAPKVRIAEKESSKLSEKKVKDAEDELKAETEVAEIKPIRKSQQV